MSITQTASSLYKGVKSVPRKLFGTRNDRVLKVLRRQTEPINELESSLRGDFDETLERRISQDGIMDLPDEEREAPLRALRLELSGDLLERVGELRKQAGEITGPLQRWWHGLEPSKRVDEYHKDEFRKRNTKVILELEQSGTLACAFGLLREASRRAQDHRHFDCQLIGGRVLFEGRIAEMKTGEGKTIVCHLAAFLNVICGHKAHVVTVNDYLVRRDAEFAAPIFELVGVSVGYIQSQVDPGGREGIRHRAYACDVTYGTNAEFGFDYLRDNMKTTLAEQVQGSLDYVIVDEVDSILIDEARTPLIISGPTQDDVTRYPRANKVAEELARRQVSWDRKIVATVAKFDGDTKNIPKLEDAMNILGYSKSRGGKDLEAAASTASTSETGEPDDNTMAALGPDFLTDDQVEALQIYENDILKLPAAEQYRRYFIVQTERKQVGITHDGVTIAQELLDIGSLYGGDNMEWPHLIENALRAHKVYKRDKDYVVQNGEIIIVDPFTGRLMIGRQWSDGLHQAVEAKEAVRVKEETQTLATITIQNFVKLYPVRAGMTGTALTEATEFDKIYALDVVEIPTNRPVNRVEHNDKMYRDVEQKYGAIVEEIHQVHRRGRPADPFLLADILTELRRIFKSQGKGIGRIDEAIKQFNNAKEDDTKVTRLLLEVYDESMGDLARGRPVLVGTTSVENSEKLSKMLQQRYAIDHEVLNAKNHAREAEIVTKAGMTTLPSKGADKTPLGNVTIATNMAGRGTDIKLGDDVVYQTCKVPDPLPEGAEANPLYPIGIAKCCIRCEEYDPQTNCAHCFKPKLDSRFPELGRKVCSLNSPCGLHIIGTERHEARRIDNQLRGRAGRQGDPGSARFSLSLQDDLLKLFMPDWMLKMMEKLGFTEGASLEDKRLTKGIERAQRKVEERNFSTRKHLLEWDEPMDFQRKEFYSARQRILEERDLPNLIFATVDNAISTTLDQYLGGQFSRICIAEWCRTTLDVIIEEDSIDAEDVETAGDSIRKKAKDEAADQIRTSIGEYIDVEEAPSQWDVGGLLRWAQRQYKVPLTQNQMRKMDPTDIEDYLFEAANSHYDSIDFAGIAPFLERDYPYRSLAEWGRAKFAIELVVDELIDTPQEDIAALIHERVLLAYREREVCYPVEWCIERALGDEQTDNASAASEVVDWTNRKFDAGWTLENVQDKSVSQLRDELVALNREFLGGRLEKEVSGVIEGMERDQAIEWAKNRFGLAWHQDRFDREMENHEDADGAWMDSILAQGREMLRWELTRLEQYVLLRLYDQAWKDHLLEMDHLKTAIMQRPLGGDQSHPQSQFAIEGRDLFAQMWARIAGRVTDIIFKVRVSAGPAEQTARSKASMSFSHGESAGAGFAGASADQDAAMKAQNTDAKAETIRREEPKVGRNQPCPCGSGKKYKQCHGRR